MTSTMHQHLLAQVPDLIALAAGYPQHFPYLLQSAGAEGWDMLFAMPQSARVYAAHEGQCLFDDLAAIKLNPQPARSHLPFVGGWFVYLGYEWLETLEGRVPPRLADDFPLGLLARVPAAILYERERKVCWLVTETLAQQQQILALLGDLPPFAAQPVQLQQLSEDPPDAFLDGVRRCKRYIVDGDVFQVNLSRGWHADLAGQVRAVDVYARLRQSNPAPFSAWVDLGGGRHIISSSPERLAQIDGQGRVQTRPIAGTHARSPDADEDARQKARLIASTKERAEHVMLIDLERNDLGRIAVPGSVKVDALMEVTSYTFVHHIESTVSCQARAGLSVADVARALFPGGTITGCPKVRTMQIIP